MDRTGADRVRRRSEVLATGGCTVHGGPASDLAGDAVAVLVELAAVAGVTLDERSGAGVTGLRTRAEALPGRRGRRGLRGRGLRGAGIRDGPDHLPALRDGGGRDTGCARPDDRRRPPRAAQVDVHG